MDYTLIIPAFIAGVLTFLAPCTLPLVPGYLAFVSGVSLDDLHDSQKSKRARFRIFLNGLFFVAGFSAVFIIFGTLAGFLGTALVPYRLWLARIGGIFVILFGLFILGAFKIPMLAREQKLPVPPIFKRGRPFNAVVLGAAFGAGWTPCIGPILGSILFLASMSAMAFKGALLLAVFSVGLAVPFLLIAIGIGSASQHIARIGRYLNAVSFVGGIFLVFLGILLLTNNFSLLVSWGFQLLRFINYDALLDYL